MYKDFQKHLVAELDEIRQAGLYKNERIICSPQSSRIKLENGEEVLNFCANNYLGLADNPELMAAARQAMDERGYGMSSVRFMARRTPSCTQPASMPTAACLSRC